MDCNACGQECQLRRKQKWPTNRNRASPSANPELEMAMQESHTVKKHEIPSPELQGNSRAQRRRMQSRVFRGLQVSTSREIGVWSAELRRRLGSPQILRKIEL